jgi:hypothetical protein
VTIVMGGRDVDIGLLVNLRKFIEDECIVGLCSVERCGALTYISFSKWWSRGFHEFAVVEQEI